MEPVSQEVPSTQPSGEEARLSPLTYTKSPMSSSSSSGSRDTWEYRTLCTWGKKEGAGVISVDIKVLIMEQCE